jgi:hypothetical protein
MNNPTAAPVTDSFETVTSNPPLKPVVKVQQKPILPKVVPPKPKPVLPPRPQPIQQPSSGLDWLEENMTTRRASDTQTKKAQAEQEQKQREQLEKMKELDNKRSRQMYEEIQQQIQLIRKKKIQEPAKYVTGAAGYNPEQHQDPETFWDKVKKKQEDAKKKLPWTSKQGMGTGEITRGVSG